MRWATGCDRMAAGCGLSIAPAWLPCEFAACMAAFCFALWSALHLPTTLAAFMVRMACGSVCLQFGHELRILLEPFMVFEENTTDSLCDLRRDLVHIDMNVSIHLCLLLLSVVSGLVVHIRQQHMIDKLQDVQRNALPTL